MIRIGLRLIALLLCSTTLPAEVKRLVILKADGLPGWLVERMLAERDPATGKSRLPWIERTFVERGVWLRNFYCRGLSLSVPAWSILDTGHPMAIRGNVEYDRYTLRAFDYLNFIPFYFRSMFSKTADMPGVEVLDDLGIALLSDRFAPEQTRQSFQLYQRGIRWNTFKSAVRNRFPIGSPRELLGEWQAGFELSRSLQDEIERGLIAALSNEQLLYLDLFTGDFDHLAHLDNSEEAQRGVVSRIDRMVGRVWSAIEKSALADHTLLVLVSDHGMNTSPRTYSQGYNLVELFRSVAGGAHHTVTNRHPLSEYKLRGLHPFVHRVFTESAASPYGVTSPKDYPTALLDLDGNERAAIYLRNSDLNKIHLLLLQLERRDLAPALRSAAEEACRRAIETFAGQSRPRIDRMRPELDALRTSIAELKSRIRPADRGPQVIRMRARISSWTTDERAYHQAIKTIERLLSAAFPSRTAASTLVPKRLAGEPNTIHQLQNYVVSIAPDGLQLAADGSLDHARSFRSLNYFDLLSGLTVRNVVQDHVASRPVDFIAVRVPPEALSSALPEERADAGVWLNSGPDRQLLILVRGDPVQIKVLPVVRLQGAVDGSIAFGSLKWQPGLPLKLLEDDRFGIPASEREQWLSEWHSERDWLRASHQSTYSNAVIGLFEHFRPTGPGRDGTGFHWTRRELLEADLLVLAANHWNFNVRGFNPGGNHGGFMRVSTHSVLMMAGGNASGVGRGVSIAEPYDSLSLVPTLLALMGRCNADLSGARIRQAGEMLCEDAK